MIEAPAPNLHPDPRARIAHWKAIVARYQQPHFGRALWQIVNSHGSYVAVWVLMYLALHVSWWLAMPLALLAGGLLVRIFIIFHDCGHGSFFGSTRTNSFVGSLSGVLTFTPYFQWRGDHTRHHKTSGDLDRRGIGDVWTLTVDEYLAASKLRRIAYQIARNPFVLFVLAPLVVFLVVQRFPTKNASRRERHSVWWMNFAILVVAAVMSWIFGIVPYLILQAVILAVAGSAGFWLFYVQHQFEDVSWERGEDWDYTTAALSGSSFYRLPRVLQWFSGNIGFHHVHHLSPRIANYNLEACHRSDPLFEEVKPLTLMASRRSFTLRLWDEGTHKLVGFRHLRELRRQSEHEGSRAPK
jgi:omega-6 fatty acid desaturase (delta-12 desaturase)